MGASKCNISKDCMICNLDSIYGCGVYRKSNSTNGLFIGCTESKRAVKEKSWVRRSFFSLLGGF